jgi:2-phosphosulfolactate phosphatase
MRKTGPKIACKAPFWGKNRAKSLNSKKISWSDPEIVRVGLREGAEGARGTAVIIDVFRAFTCEPLMFHFGAARVMLEADPDRCLAFRDDALLVGERDELPIPGFDLTNSPYLIMSKGCPFFEGRNVVHRTTSGVTGAVAAMRSADEVLLASFVNAKATAAYIKSRAPKTVAIVAMGIRSRQKAPEDEACGDYIESLLTGKPYDHVEATRSILSHETAQKFLRGDKEYLPREDPAICLQRDLFDFALLARSRNGTICAERVGIE